MRPGVEMFEQECPGSPESCLRLGHLGKSTFMLLEVLRECMLVEGWLTEEHERTLEIKSRFLGYLWIVMAVAAQESDTNRILSLQRLFKLPFEEPAMTLGDDQDLLAWCVRELGRIGLLTDADLDDYRDNCRHFHPRSERNEGFRMLQTRLGAHGFAVEVDGFLGWRTVEALQAFQRSEGIAPTQFPGSTTLVALGINPDEFWSLSVSTDFVRSLQWDSEDGADPDSNFTRGRLGRRW